MRRIAFTVRTAAMFCALAGFIGPWSNALSANTSSPPVLGIDVYGGNGTMNWSTIASNGIQFAWAKATQGNDYQDAQLSNNESGATANGIYIGAYDFADPSNVNPVTEAAYFVDYAQQSGAFNTGKLLPALDMEQVGSTIDGASSLTAWINDWSAEVFTLTGVHPLLYCSPSFLSDNNITSTGVPLWLADWTYPSNLSNTAPPAGSYSPWSTWTFWQYSDKGSVGGDPSTVDLDAYNGNLSSMVANEVIPSITWSGNSNGTWDNATTGAGSGTQNWIYGMSGTTKALYYDGRAVIFQDTNLVNNSQVTHSSVSISSTVTPQSMTFIANTVNYTFTGAAIAGAGGLTLNGTASVTLNNATAASPDTFSGAIAINKGQLILDHGWSAGDASGTTVASGGALVLNNTSGSATTFGTLVGGGGISPLSIAGAGLASSPAGALESLKGNNSYSGAISLSGNATIESASTTSGDSLNLTGGIATNGHTLTFAGPGTTVVSGFTTGSSTVQVSSGTLSITSSSSPLGTGTLMLAGGTLNFAAPAAIGIHIAADQNSTDGGTTGEQPEQIGTSAVAGVAPIDNWNDFVITRFRTGENKSSFNLPLAQSVPTSLTPFALTDASGATTTAQVTAWSGNNSYSVYGTTETNPNAQLVNGLLGAINDNSSSNHPAVVTVSNVPYASGYSVYVYFNNDRSAQPGQVSLTSGTYTSANYYVQSEGQESQNTSPFFVSGTSSTTAGTYTTSNYVEIPVPAIGTQGASNQFTVSFNVAQSGTNSYTPGIAAIEIVANSGATLGNAVSVTSNSTIDVTGVSSAALGPLSIGAKTLSVTGGSTGAGAPYTLTLGTTSLTGNATFNVANNANGSGSGTLNLGAIGDGGAGHSITLTGPGTVSLTNSTGSSYQGGTAVSAGTLQLYNMSGNSSDSATGSGTVTISGSGTLAGPTNSSGIAYISGSVNVASGGAIAITGGSISLSSGLSFASGAIFDVSLPSAAGSSAPLISVNGTLTLSQDLAIGVTQGSGFSSGAVYPLVHYSSLADNSENQTGWTISGGPTGFTPTIVFDTTNDNLDLEFVSIKVQNNLTSYNGASGTPGTVFGGAASWSVPNASGYAGYTVQADGQTTGGTGSANGYGPLLTSDGSGNNLYGEIRAGNNSGSYTSGAAAPLQMSWRNRTLQETAAQEGGTPTAPPLSNVFAALISNVLNISGMSIAAGEPVQTDPFVLQMNYDAALLKNESAQSKANEIYLAWLNPNGAGANAPQWQNATTGDFGPIGADAGALGIDFQGSFDVFLSAEEAHDPADFPGDPTAPNLTNIELDQLMGAYGVDTTNHDVWAVINHNSEFAVVPEPSTLVLAAAGLLAAAWCGFRREVRRHGTLRSNRTSDGPDNRQRRGSRSSAGTARIARLVVSTLALPNGLDAAS